MKRHPVVILMQLLLMLLMLFLAQPAFAQNDQGQPDQPEYGQQELDQMLAPIALYPDALLSQILEASTYPLEVVEAARWSREHPELKGEDAVKAAQENDWDPSVISLTAFPQVLAEMDAKLDWTEHLGDAFLAQEAQVMDTVQNLREKAEVAGYLQSNDQIQVERHDQIIVIEQAAPQRIYVPYYNPTVVYGPWWWDAYPPVYWDPWPGYYSPGYGNAFYWGSGITIGTGFFFSDFDWRRRHINVHRSRDWQGRDWQGRDWQNRDRELHTLPPVNARNSRVHTWQHDPAHRHGVPYPQTTVQQSGRTNNLGSSRNFQGQGETSLLDIARQQQQQRMEPNRIQSQSGEQSLNSIPTAGSNQGGRPDWHGNSNNRILQRNVAPTNRTTINSDTTTKATGIEDQLQRAPQDQMQTRRPAPLATPVPSIRQSPAPGSTSPSMSNPQGAGTDIGGINNQPGLHLGPAASRSHGNQGTQPTNRTTINSDTATKATGIEDRLQRTPQDQMRIRRPAPLATPAPSIRQFPGSASPSMSNPQGSDRGIGGLNNQSGLYRGPARSPITQQRPITTAPPRSYGNQGAQSHPQGFGNQGNGGFGRQGNGDGNSLGNLAH